MKGIYYSILVLKIHLKIYKLIIKELLKNNYRITKK